jgi:hypothetical protein
VPTVTAASPRPRSYEGKDDEYHITVTADSYLDGQSFLGRLAAKQILSGVVVKLARVTGEIAKEETTRVTGVVTRGGKAVGGGTRGRRSSRQELWSSTTSGTQK